MKKLFGIVLVLALVLSFSLVATTPVAADPPAEVWVCADGGNDGNPGTEAEPFETIQKGVDEVAEDGTVYVKEGTYQEQLLIDKGLTLRPATLNGDFVAVTIKAPDYEDRTRIEASWGRLCDYIILVTASDVTIEGFIIEGQDGMYDGTNHRMRDSGEFEPGEPGDSGDRVGFYGIWYDGEDEGGITGGQVRNNTITDVTGWATASIMVSDGAEVAVEENVIPIHVWGNVGISAVMTDTVVNVYGNEMSGTVGDSDWSQGGIQFAGFATGTATYNTVEDLRSGTGAMSTGIAVYQGSEVGLIEHNTLDNTDCAILVAGYGVATKVDEIKDNTLINSTYFGIAVYALGEVDLIEHNILYGTEWHGISTSVGAKIDVIQCNTIRDNLISGIRLRPDTLSGNVRYNNIFGNAEWGINNEGAEDVDAILNWWGDASGPSDEGPGTGDAVSENVEFDPWLMEEDGAETTETDTDSGVDAEASTTNVSATADGGDATTTVSVGEYVDNPTSVSPGFRAGAVYVDVHVGGTLPDELVVEIECPGTCSGVELKWWDGTEWKVVVVQEIDNGIVRATLNEVDSSPLLSQLTGTPFGLGSLSTVGWEGSSVNKAAVMAPWVALLATMMAGVSLLVLRRRRAQI